MNHEILPRIQSIGVSSGGGGRRDCDRLVHLSVRLALEPPPDRVVPLRVELDLEHVGRGRVERVEVVGLGKEPVEDIAVSLKLVPGEYRITCPRQPEVGSRFRVLSRVSAQIMMLCRHRQTRCSQMQAWTILDRQGRWLMAGNEGRMQSCCYTWEATIKRGNVYALGMHWSTRGPFTAELEGWRVVNPGTCLVVNPTQVLRISGENQWPLALQSVYFSQTALRRFREAVGLPRLRGPFDFEVGPHRITPPLAKAFDLVEEAREEFSRPEVQEWGRLASHWMLLRLLQHVPNRLYGPPLREKSGDQDARMKSAVTYLTDHLGENIDIEELAREAGAGVRWLQLQFSTRFGCSPMGYLRTLRVHRAAELFHQGSQKIEEVAMAVGYRDVSAFYRAYKEVMRVTPGLSARAGRIRITA